MRAERRRWHPGRLGLGLAFGLAALAGDAPCVSARAPASTLAVEGPCVVACPGAELVLRLSGDNTGAAPATIEVEMLVPFRRSLLDVDVDPGPFTVHEVIALDPPRTACPVTIQLLATLRTASGEAVETTFQVEAVPRSGQDSGGPGAEEAVLLWDVAGAAGGDRLGAAVAQAGDVTGDGVAEVAVGAPFAGPNGAGELRVLSGTDGVEVLRLGGAAAADRFAAAVAASADLDGDGVSDLIVGSPGFEGGGGANSGRVEAISAVTGLTLWSADGAGAFAAFATAVTTTGDLDGDGISDVAVGAPGHDGPGGDASGQLVVLSGAAGSVLWTAAGEAALDGFAAAVATLPDADGDGTDDVAVGAPDHDGPVGTGSGRVYLYSGADGAPIAILDAESAESAFGAALAGLPDLDGDGAGELVAGAWGQLTAAGEDAGRVYLYSGATRQLRWRADGELGGDRFGFAVARAGDLDGDGSADLLAGAPEHASPPGVARGRATALSGADGARLVATLGEGVGEEHGAAVAGHADTDGDGVGELLVGAPGHFTGAGVDAGRAYLYSASVLLSSLSVEATCLSRCPGGSVVVVLSGQNAAAADGSLRVDVGPPYDATLASYVVLPGPFTVYDTFVLPPGQPAACPTTLTFTASLRDGDGALRSAVFTSEAVSLDGGRARDRGVARERSRRRRAAP